MEKYHETTSRWRINAGGSLLDMGTEGAMCGKDIEEGRRNLSLGQEQIGEDGGSM